MNVAMLNDLLTVEAVYCGFYAGLYKKEKYRERNSFACRTDLYCSPNL